MRSIQELIASLPAITKVSITAQQKAPVLFPLKDTTYNLQLVFFWWKDALESYNTITNSEVISEGTSKEPLSLITPSLIGVKEHLDYLETELLSLIDGTEKYLDDAAIPSAVDYKLRQGYNRLKEAHFNTKLSLNYYGQITSEQ